MRKLSKYGKLKKLHEEVLDNISFWRDAHDRINKEKSKIVEALFGETYKTISIDKILESINDLKGQIKGMERLMEDVGGREMLIDKENAKLWYLVRAITKDPTLSDEAVNHEEYDPRFLGVKKSPFTKPKF